MTYQDVLDRIFESFLKAKPFLEGRFDRDVRDPERLLNIARNLNLLPPAAKTIIVTGSKGKGSCARLIASGLQQTLSDAKVALMVSPEEFEHTDRIRINAKTISKTDFIYHYEQISNFLFPLEPPAYYSPYGLFLLIALSWFKENACTHYVLETGRGVRFDEGGQIAAEVGVVTSIFLEHAAQIGPTLKEIREDKLSLAENCQHLVIGNQVKGEALRGGASLPSWVFESHRLSNEALGVFLKRLDVRFTPCPLPSFGCREFKDGLILYYEALIARESADLDFLEALLKRHKGCMAFFVCLPDDKDINGISTALLGLGADVRYLKITGERGIMTYQKTPPAVIYDGPFNDPHALQKSLDFTGLEAAYFIGPQTFIRLVREAYFAKCD